MKDAITGTCASGWERVRDALSDNLATRDEIGANVCVVHRGERVVDIAGGWADRGRRRPDDGAS